MKFDLKTFHIRAYSDSSFASNDDHTPQHGYLFLLCDESDSCDITHYKKYESQRVVWSVPGGDVYAFADAFDLAYTLKFDLERTFDQYIPI